MGINIGELNETLKARRNDMLNNRMLTNELIIDDIMVELGYNKKRDASVKRLYSGPIDWELKSSTDKKLAVKVFAVGEEINQQELDETIDKCKEKLFSILIVTNGEHIKVYRYIKEMREYVEITSVSLDEELSETNAKVLEAISKNTFDLAIIDDLLKTTVVTYEDAERIFAEHKVDITNKLTTWIKLEFSDCNNADAIAKEYTEQLFSIDNAEKIEKTENVSEDSTLLEENEKLKESNASLESQLEELKSKVEELENNENTLITNNDTDNSDAKIQELESKLQELEEENTVLKATSTEKSDDTQIDDSKLQELESKIQELENENATLKESNNKQVEELEKEIESLKSSETSAEGSDEHLDRNKIDSYTAQIRELSVKLSETNEEMGKLKEELDKKQQEIDSMSGADRQRAKELLDVIEDSDELDRHYVAVINTELIQYEKLHTFIGRSLQKLFELKSLEASQYIFNGDIFKLSNTSKYNDIMMNNKTYDIILGDMNEDEALNKLRVVFSHFDDIIFECKKIGRLNKDAIQEEEEVVNKKPEVQVETDEYLDEMEESEGNETDANEEIAFGEPESQDEFTPIESLDSEGQFNENELFGTEEQGYTADGFDNNGYDNNGYEVVNAEGFVDENGQQFIGDEEQQFEGNWDANNLDGFDNVPDEQEFDPNEQNVMLVGQLLAIDELIWTEEKVNFNYIKYIGTNDITFAINVQNKDSYDMLLCKCIDAVLAIDSYRGNTSIITNLKDTDFSTVNNFLKLYTEEYRGYPRINGTRYSIVGISSVQQVASVLFDICNELKIDTTEIWIYFDTTTSSQPIIEDYSFPEESIQLCETTLYEPDDTDGEAIAILKGDMLNNMVVTKNSLQMHREVLKQALAIKTKYLAKVLDADDSVTEVINTMLIEAYKNNLRINLDGIGNLIGTNHKLLSSNPNEVGENPAELIGGSGDKVYCAVMEPWQVPYSLIKIHITIFNNSSIAIKTSINSSALNFYGNEFQTSEPSLALAIKSYVDYVASCIKK